MAEWKGCRIIGHEESRVRGFPEIDQTHPVKSRIPILGLMSTNEESTTIDGISEIDSFETGEIL